MNYLLFSKGYEKYWVLGFLTVISIYLSIITGILLAIVSFL